MTHFLSIQGDYALLQCLKPCSSQAVYETRPFIERALPHINPQTMEIPSKFIPKCPRCNGPMFFCVRGGEWFIESAFDDQRRRYHDFIHRALNKKDDLFTIIEVGVSINTPAVLRRSMDQFVSEFKHVRLVRINMQAPDVPIHARKEQKAIGLDGNASQVIRQIADMITKIDI